tara:strand:+ start:736 stop:867 length:132 start_codon:yes stop_codon:yes gene_type:complete
MKVNTDPVLEEMLKASNQFSKMFKPKKKKKKVKIKMYQQKGAR